MKAGETMCYYRARGGEKSIYITVLYDNNQLRESIIQNYIPQTIRTTHQVKKKCLSA